MVLPRRRMNSRGRHRGPLSSPFFERPGPTKINQGRNNNYFNQQSHTKWETRRRSWAKAMLILCELASEPPRSTDLGYNLPSLAWCYEGEWPSTSIMFVRAVRWRILRGSRYSSQLSHSLASCVDSNSSTTMRFGFQSPSSTSVLPPRTMYFPPYFSTVAPANFLYSS